MKESHPDLKQVPEQVVAEFLETHKDISPRDLLRAFTTPPAPELGNPAVELPPGIGGITVSMLGN